MANVEQPDVYLGIRGDEFRKMIESILIKANIKKAYRDLLLDPVSMDRYDEAFTSDIINADKNYQVAEMIGDLSANKAIVAWMLKKFNLKHPKYVQILARLRINYGAKNSFSKIAFENNFWPFISATNDLRQRKMKPLLEDVFEAFLGTTEMLLDERVLSLRSANSRECIGVGYAVVYKIISSIFDSMHISLLYEDLYDAKTRLKELLDMYEPQLGPVIYVDKKDDMIQKSTIFQVKDGKYQVKPDGSLNKNRIIGGTYHELGSGCASLRADAQQKAAAVALDTLAKQGWKKPVPAIYRILNDGEQETKTLDVNDIRNIWGNDMKELHHTKEKTKYQNQYKSTAIAKYCRERNISGVSSCLKLGASPNDLDTDGMFATDLLFIGCVDENLVESIMSLMIEKENLKMHQTVFDLYYKRYIGKYFTEVMNNITLV